MISEKFRCLMKSLCREYLKVCRGISLYGMVHTIHIYIYIVFDMFELPHINFEYGTEFISNTNPSYIKKCGLCC